MQYKILYQHGVSLPVAPSMLCSRCSGVLRVQLRAPPQYNLCCFLCCAATAVECFVCSYAPRSNSTRIDGCTESNFTEIVIDTRTCDFGCERVASYDVNGKQGEREWRVMMSTVSRIRESGELCQR